MDPRLAPAWVSVRITSATTAVSKIALARGPSRAWRAVRMPVR
jgi:hypothetical protein